MYVYCKILAPEVEVFACVALDSRAFRYMRARTSYFQQDLCRQCCSWFGCVAYETVLGLWELLHAQQGRARKNAQEPPHIPEPLRFRELTFRRQPTSSLLLPQQQSPCASLKTAPPPSATQPPSPPHPFPPYAPQKQH